MGGAPLTAASAVIPLYVSSLFPSRWGLDTLALLRSTRDCHDEIAVCALQVGIPSAVCFCLAGAPRDKLCMCRL